MQQRVESQDSERAPGVRKKVRVAPVTGRLRDDQSAQAPAPLRRFIPRVSKLKILNRFRPLEEEVTKWQTKCFLFVLGGVIIAMGSGLTYYGVHSDLRDFKILGPGLLIIGFILEVIALGLIIKDVYILNRPKYEEHTNEKDEEINNFYNTRPIEFEEVVTANSQRMDLYTVTSPRSESVVTSRPDSGGAITASNTVVQTAAHDQETPEPVVAAYYADTDSPIRTVKHPTANPSSSSIGIATASGQAGSTITVRSKEDNPEQGSDSGGSCSDNGQRPSLKSRKTSLQTYKVSMKVDFGEQRIKSAPGTRSETEHVASTKDEIPQNPVIAFAEDTEL